VVLACGALAVAALALAKGNDDYVMNITIFTLFWATASTAWNILGGYTGMVSLGHSLFFGGSAYLVAILVTMYHYAWWIATVVSAGAVTVCGTFLLYPAFRLRGPFFSLATFALPTVAAIVAIYQVGLTNGPQGLTWPLERSPLLFTFQSRIPYLAVIAAFLATAITTSDVLDRRRLGIYMKATRDDDVAAEAAAVPTTAVKVMASAISIVLTALCGAFYVAYVAFIDPPSAFSLNFSLEVVLLAILGGLGKVYGPLLGAAVLIPADFVLSAAFSGSVHLLLLGALLMIVVLFLPQGLIGGVSAAVKRVAR